MLILIHFLLTFCLGFCEININKYLNYNELNGTEWRLVEVEKNGSLVPVDHLVTIYFLEDGKNVKANDGCNSLSGKINLSSTKLSIQHFSTKNKISCKQKKHTEIARKFISGLKINSSYYIKDSYLIIRSGAKAILVFAKLNSEGSNQLITKKSFKVYSEYSTQNGHNLLRLYDPARKKELLLDAIQGFEFESGYTYDIQVKSIFQNDNEGKVVKESHHLIKIVQKLKGDIDFQYTN